MTAGGSSINVGSNMSTHVFLNLLNILRNREKMPGLPSILLTFHNEFVDILTL